MSRLRCVAIALALLAHLGAAGCTDDPSRSQLYSISGHVIAFVQGRDDAGDSTGFFLVEQPPGVIVLLMQAGAPVDSIATNVEGDYRFDYRTAGDYQILVRDMDTLAVTVMGSNTNAPDTLEVYPFGEMTAYPNPFDLGLTMTATLADGRAVLRIHRPGSSAVLRTLFDRTFTAGDYDFLWDALDDNGDVVPPGLYLAVLEQGGVSQVQVLARCIVPTCLETRPVRRRLDVSSRP